MTFEVSYGALANITSDYHNASQSLVQEMVDHRDVESNGADGIPAENYKGKTYTIQHPGKYRYYALYIFDKWGDRYMQLGGFRFDQWEK